MNKIFFDIETLTLNPYEENAKIITIQLGTRHYNRVNDIIILKEWLCDEKTIIASAFNILVKERPYTPLITYNGSFDINYLMGRINMLDFSIEEKMKLHEVFVKRVKHCDLLQFDNGYFVSLEKICRKHGIRPKYKNYGKMMSELYYNKDYDKIVVHGKEDIELLMELVEKSNLFDRFSIVSVL